MFLVLLILAFAAGASAQTAPNTAAYQSRCASCHGATMTGSTAPAILTYIRYHTDAEVTAAIRERHRSVPAVSIPDAELPATLSGMRELAGTNPAMATGGFTGRRGGAGAAPVPPAPAPSRGAAPAPAATPGVEGLQWPPIVRCGNLRSDSMTRLD